MPRSPLTSALLLLLLLTGCTAHSGSELTADRLVEGLSDACLDACLVSLRQTVETPIRQLQDQVSAVLQAQPQTLPAVSCPPHWLHHGDSCYLIPSEKTTWMVAHHACAQLDSRARLVSIHRDNHQDVISVLSVAQTWDVWIGLVRVGINPSTFGWIDGTPFDMANWQRGEPNNALQNTESCGSVHGALFGEDRRYTWNDIVCTKVFRFMCQIKLTGM